MVRSDDRTLGEAPEIYVASLLDYLYGVLHGTWIDARQPPQVMLQQVFDMLAASPTTAKTGELAEEWAIHDTTGFERVSIDPHESLEEVHAIAVRITDGRHPPCARPIDHATRLSRADP